MKFEWVAGYQNVFYVIFNKLAWLLLIIFAMIDLPVPRAIMGDMRDLSIRIAKLQINFQSLLIRKR